MSITFVRQEMILCMDRHAAYAAKVSAHSDDFPAFVALQPVSEFLSMASVGIPELRSAVAADPRVPSSLAEVIAEVVSYEAAIAEDNYFENLTLVPFNDLYYQLGFFFRNSTASASSLQAVFDLLLSAASEESWHDGTQWMKLLEGELIALQGWNFDKLSPESMGAFASYVDGVFSYESFLSSVDVEQFLLGRCYRPFSDDDYRRFPIYKVN
jgi:hypothetical protein